MPTPSPTSPQMLSDLLDTRARLLAGQTRASAEIDRALEAAGSPRCAHTFLVRTDDEARAAAALPANAQRPLAGLAVSVKDLFDVRGQVTRAGSVALNDAEPAAQDSDAVALLRAAGAAIVGRTNMTEFAFSGVGTNPHHGTPPNAADAATPRIPGGSSSGAAVSVATGAAFIGLGSDTGGSIRIPAALNGIVGFKNTAALTSARGAVPLSTTLDTVCAMTRSVRDTILAHEILARRTVTRSAAPLSSYRIAVARTGMLDALEPAVARAFERALSRLSAAGARIEEVELGEIRDLGAIQSSAGFAAVESYAWHRPLLARKAEAYDPRVRMRIVRGEAIKAWEYVDLFAARAQWIARVQAALRGFDAVASPTVPLVAPPIAEVAPGTERDARFFEVNTLLLRNTSVVNMLDGCAISLPCQAAGELPVGLMLWHQAFHDDTVLNIALQAEAALRAGA